MDRSVQIINIDGTRGSGKTTQLNHLLNSLRGDGFAVLKNTMDGSIGSALECAEKTKSFLTDNPSGIVLNDGSIARMVVERLLRGGSQDAVRDELRHVVSEHEKMCHQYHTANILILLDNVALCNQRLQKEAKLLQRDTYNLINPVNEKEIVIGLKNFDSNMIVNNIRFKSIEIGANDTILRVTELVWKCLDSHFGLKKPSL